MRRYIRHFNLDKRFGGGFTIVELLVVVVIIAVLAAISLVMYSGISQKAIASVLQSDLSNAATAIKAFQVENSNFPTTISTNCSTNPDSSTNKCIKLSSGNSLVGYSANNIATPKDFVLIIKNNTNVYKVTDKTNPTQLANTMQPGVTPGALVELHAAKADGGTGPGINSPLTTTWTDTSGSSNNGILTNFGAQTSWSGAGTAGDPYRVIGDGVNDRIDLPVYPLMADAQFTAEIWVRTEAVNATVNRGIIGNRDTALNRGFRLYIGNTGSSPTWRVYNGTSSTFIDAGASIVGVMQQLVLTFDGTTAKPYANGAPTAGAVGYAYVPKSAGTARIMTYDDGTTPFDGSLYCVRYYPFALSGAQVTANYNAGVDW